MTKVRRDYQIMKDRADSREKTRTTALFTLLFLVTAVGSFACFLFSGKSLIWQIDGVGQYFPAFLYIGNYIREFIKNLFSGHLALPLYDLRIGMGEDIIGTLNYYGFGDPFNLLSVLAKGRAALVLYEILWFVRLYLAGLCFLYYLKKMALTGWPAAAAALCYVFSGWSIYGVASYPEWGALLIYLPLMLAASEMIMRENEAADNDVRGRRKALTRGRLLMSAAVLYGALSGFYYLYMASLALAVYVIARLIARRKKAGFRQAFMVCATCLAFYLIGISLSAPLLLPALDQYLMSQRADTSILQVLTDWPLYKPADNWIFRSVCLNVHGPQKSYLTGITVFETLACLGLLVLPKAILPVNKARWQLLAALALILLAVHVPMTGFLFNGFGETNFRWCFLVHFLFSVILAYVCTALFRRKRTAANNRYGGNAADRKRRGIKQAAGAAVTLAVAANLILHANLFFTGEAIRWMDEFLPAEGLVETYIDSPLTAVKAIDGSSDVYRIAAAPITNVNGRPENVSMLNDYCGLTYWWSIVNSRTQSFVNLVNSQGLRWRSFGSYGSTDIESLAGVRYFLTNDGAIPGGYEYAGETTRNGRNWVIYRNPSSRGMAYVRNPALAKTLWAGTVKEGSPDQTEALTAEAYHNNVYAKMQDTGVDGSAFCAYLNALNQAVSGEEGHVTGFAYDRSRDRITLSADVAKNGSELVIAVPFHKNWSAYVDGKKVSLHDTDVMFTAIDDLTAGRHTVELKYVPKAFYAGLAAGALGIALLIVLMLLDRRRLRRRYR